MRSARPKVLCEVLFRPMICWIADTLEKCGIGEVCAVLGAGADQVRAAIPRFAWVEQKERLGTGHAVMQARAFLESHRGGDCAVLYGDAPFVDADTLENAYRLHKKEGAAVTLLTASFRTPPATGGLSGARAEMCPALSNRRTRMKKRCKSGRSTPGLTGFRWIFCWTRWTGCGRTMRRANIT